MCFAKLLYKGKVFLAVILADMVQALVSLFSTEKLFTTPISTWKNVLYEL